MVVQDPTTSTQTTQRVLKVGIVGLGRAATSMLPSIAAHPYVKITAGTAPRQEPRDAFAQQHDAVGYATMEEMCARSDVDAAYIATPHQLHAEQVLIAASYGKHVICEKPMALTLEDCDTMIEAAEKAGICLLLGHSHGFDPPVLKMRQIIRSGELGSLGMIHTWNYTDFLYRPRRPEELDTSKGGGIIFNQVPHQVEIVRLLGGGMVRSVRAMAGVWDSARPTEGAHSTYLEFEDGVPATVVYSGYDHYTTDELHAWVGEGGTPRKPDVFGEARRALRGVEDEWATKRSTGFGGKSQRHLGGVQGERHQPHFGITVVSCHDGDMRLAPDGLLVYDTEGRREVPVPLGRTTPDKGKVMDEFYDAVVHGTPLIHDGRWGKASLEVCLAILQSSRERREVFLHHQVPVRD